MQENEKPKPKSTKIKNQLTATRGKKPTQNDQN